MPPSTRPGPARASTRTAGARTRGSAARGTAPSRSGGAAAPRRSGRSPPRAGTASSRPIAELPMSFRPANTMFSATAMAISGSRRSQPVQPTSSTATMTPPEVHTSVMRCLESACSTIERCLSPARMRMRGDDEVQDRGDARDEQADPEVLQRLRVEEPGDGGEHDQPGGDQDHQALEQGREVLRLAQAEVVARVTGPGGGLQRHQGDDGRHDVDRRLERIGEQAHGVGEEVGVQLEAEHHDPGGDRQPREPGEILLTIMHGAHPVTGAGAVRGDTGAADPPRQPGGPAAHGPGVQIAHGAGDTGQ